MGSNTEQNIKNLLIALNLKSEKKGTSYRLGFNYIFSSKNNVLFCVMSMSVYRNHKYSEKIEFRNKIDLITYLCDEMKKY